MRSYTQLFLLFFLLLCITASLSTLSAQKVVRATAITAETSVKPLNAKALKLNSTAARVLQSWKKAKHMKILKTGHFVPIKNPGSASQIGGNLPGGGQSNSFASGTNCAKIECPDVFDDSVTCWECH